MKRIRINTGKIGLVFKSGDYKKLLTTGTHWQFFREEVMVCDLSKEFTPPIAIEVLLKDENFTEKIEIVEVADSELVIVYENGNFYKVLEAGRYFYWKGLIHRSFQRVNISEVTIEESLHKKIFNHHALYKYIRCFEIAAYEKALLLINDECVQEIAGGIYRFWKNENTIKVMKADMRQLQLEVGGQELLTKDKASVRINFYTQYKITDLKKALLENKDYEKQLYILMQLVLRSYIGSYTLDEVLVEKERITEKVFEEAFQKATELGVEIINCGIRDVILPGDMKEIMNQVLVAQKRAQANIITRREETASTRSLLNTAKLMESNEMLFALKEMEYVEKIADKIGEITVSGKGNVIQELRKIFAVDK
ncbi:slipin family protein [Tenacibaculum maritimum]|uniref:slipin family protein n=1 Tax=Tenacibaculum maritimum TaxID=107401 RepID=UPI0012E5C8BC|nr:slipin family protein [Tenacibaculum maritimum]MCD9581651.1 slipin family protein [Tenacibaculum maritimum]MCD9636223.1 slipin family protein [Tenacibaculum maritimum]CAA0188667.1 conserved hypothetical protein [Tenacibaculum maritimum]